MAKKKKTTRRKKKTEVAAPQHLLPEGFWSQVIAVVLAATALLLIVAMFGAGGPVLEWFYMVIRSTIGWTVYALPFLLVFITVEIFRAEENKLPIVMPIASVLWVVWLAAFLQLFAPSQFMSTATDGQGGGLVGWFLDQILLSLVSSTVAGFILGILIFITTLFVLRLSPSILFSYIAEMFKRDESDINEKNAETMRAAEVEKKPAAIGELKLNEGVPTLSSEAEDKKSSRLSSLKSSVNRDKDAEEQTALTTANDPDWQGPSLDLLEKKQSPADAGDVKHNAQTIKDTLSEFNINVDMEGANIGPKVTQYTLKPPSGVKLTRITALETNIALNLAAQSLRIEAPIPGQRAVGIEVPNRKAADVRLYGVLSSKQWQKTKEALSFAIGKDIAGDSVVGELNKMPHLLIAGQTGSGKSVMINTLLTSLLYRNSPSDMKLILVDPKQVEMAPYEDIPHLLAPIITKPEECISALKWATNEMERRYSLLAEEKVRDIKSYNHRKKDETMPYIVIVIDELSDLMMLAAR
ncbi:DNA translocase FtsK 4TM domain-containing protein, partial [Candidatus Saccharibacteria bacterium]|nr:DNA translocase FtsK 4TM domain-containing protein [Candidatus Saccharibacteria bacterium]